MFGLLASTSSRRQFGHSAETASRSRLSSVCQLLLISPGSVELPFSPTMRRQPLATVQAGRP